MENKTKSEIIQEHLFLVLSCVRGYEHKGVTHDDLVKAGNVGLGKAVDVFWRTGGDFASHAQQYIEDHIRLTVEHNHMQMDFQKTQKDFGQISELLHDFCGDVSTTNRAQKFKDLCNDCEQVLVVDHRTRKITTASEFNRSEDRGNVLFLPRSNKRTKPKPYVNNLITLGRKENEDKKD